MNGMQFRGTLIGPGQALVHHVPANAQSRGAFPVMARGVSYVSSPYPDLLRQSAGNLMQAGVPFLYLPTAKAPRDMGQMVERWNVRTVFNTYA